MLSSFYTQWKGVMQRNLHSCQAHTFFFWGGGGVIFCFCHGAHEEFYRIHTVYFRMHTVFQKSTKFCSSFAENNFLSSLMFTNECMFTIIVWASQRLLRQHLVKFSTPVGVEGRLTNKKVAQFDYLIFMSEPAVSNMGLPEAGLQYIPWML